MLIVKNKNIINKEDEKIFGDKSYTVVLLKKA